MESSDIIYTSVLSVAIFSVKIILSSLLLEVILSSSIKLPVCLPSCGIHQIVAFVHYYLNYSTTILPASIIHSCDSWGSKSRCFWISWSMIPTICSMSWTSFAYPIRSSKNFSSGFSSWFRFLMGLSNSPSLFSLISSSI